MRSSVALVPVEFPTFYLYTMLVVLQAVKKYISLSSADAIVFQYKICQKYLISENKAIFYLAILGILQT